MKLDTLITNGRVHTATRSFDADIGIRGEQIVAVAQHGQLRSTSRTRIIDAKGMDVMPGAIDVHVHLALPFCGTVSCDDFEHGPRAAAAGGVTTVIDFAIPSKDESLQDAHDNWTAKSEGKSIVDYAWHIAITDRKQIRQIPQMIEQGLPTFKEFMIYESEGWNSDDAMLYATLEAIRKHDAMLLLHAESPRLLDLLIERRHTPAQMKRHGARLHAMTRPNQVEAEAIQRAIRWSEATGGQLYIVHMSTGEGADLVRDAQSRGVPVLAETCTQYLVLDDSVFARDDGHLFACCPQVKTRADIARLWRALQSGREVSVVSTDTCSFTREQKAMWWDKEGGYGDFTKIPMGLPGLDTMVPIVYTQGVRAGWISMNRLVELCCWNPARLMGLDHRKGDIAPGMDADITVIDPSHTRTVRPDRLQSRADWNPYEGMKLGGFATHTLVRGTPVVENGRVTGTPGHGRFVERWSPGGQP